MLFFQNGEVKISFCQEKCMKQSEKYKYSGLDNYCVLDSMTKTFLY